MDVCFSAALRKLVKKHLSFWSRPAKTMTTGQQLTAEVKRELFSMAASPAGLYQLALILQVLATAPAIACHTAALSVSRPTVLILMRRRMKKGTISYM